MNPKVLIVDDDIDLASEVAQFLSANKFDTRVESSVAAGIQGSLEYQPEIALLDFNLPDGEGIAILEDMVSRGDDTAVVMLSGYGTVARAVDAIKMGADDFLTKPVEPDHLLHVLNRLMEHRQLQQRLLVQELEIAQQRKEIVGSGKKTREMLATSKQAAASDATILITGETGTGKHLIAHLIHQNSPRSSRPFVYVNCASLSETLLESDLFGHEKGSFTGAHQQKKGRAELANHGTLFLDEIGELPVNLQAKLLHFIEYGEFQRIGGTQTLRADARILCATNRDLPEEIKSGRFREDLYYRIHVIQVHVPALRERPDDIPALFNHFLEHFCRESGKKRLDFPESLLTKLENYAWPGNIREMQNAMERAVVLSTGKKLGEKDFPFLSQPRSNLKDALFQPQPLQEALTAFKQRFIAEMLELHGGNQSKTANLLQIQRTYLNRLIKELGIRD